MAVRMFFKVRRYRPRQFISAGSLAAIIGGCLVLAGCSSDSDDAWSFFVGGDPAGEPPVTVEIPPSAEELGASPYGTGAVASTVPPVTQITGGAIGTSPSAAGRYGGQALVTGTFVGTKVSEYRRELESLKAAVASDSTSFHRLRGVTEENAQRYYATVAAISARLQVGTTPGNPVLVSQWNTAQSELDRIVTDIAALNSLSNSVSAHASMAVFLLDQIQAAYTISGAVEEDHRQLSFLEDEVNRTTVLIDRLLSDMSAKTTRQDNYVDNERKNLKTLSHAINNGELFGPSLANQAFVAAVAAANGTSTNLTDSGNLSGVRRPLVVIRFDRPNVPYKQALYGAISQALERRPAATFDVVAVAPNQGSPAEVALNTSASKRNAENVLRSLSEMGLPTDRVNLSATTKTSVNSNEVHVFVR